MQEERERLIACIPRLRRYARALVGDRAAADDLVQDTVERGWRKLATWRHGSDMRAWLFGIMHNLHVDQRRRQVVPTDAFDEEVHEAAIDAQHDKALAVRDLESALRMLPSEQREVLLLVALEEMSYEEVAATLNLPIGTVMSRLSRARQKLRAQMEGRMAVSPLKVVK
jgi:RNA polymerase sigma-70 factor (ECF subfamily)